MRLTDILRGSEGVHPVRAIQRALRRPWGWPQEPDLQQAAFAWDPEGGPTEPRVGETLIVTTNPQVVWELWFPTEGAPRVTWAGEAVGCAKMAPRLTQLALPLVARHDLRGAPSLHPRVYSSAGPLPGAIVGRSAGLAMCLAHASRLLGWSCPADLVALAAVSPMGKLEPVDGISEKVAWLRACAPGIRRVIVHPSQREEVEGLAPIGHQSIRDVFAYVWAEIPQRLEAAWRADPGLAAQAAHGLRREAFATNTSITAWAMIADTAERLIMVTDGGPRRDARLAAAVARRHAGLDPTWPFVEAEPEAGPERGLRLPWLAHWLQSHTDGHSDERCMDAIGRVRNEVEVAGRRTAADAILLGALGRALASCGAYEEAANVLDEAIDTWWRLEQEPDANIPLCERIRLAGLLRQSNVLNALEARVDAMGLYADVGEISRRFAELALGRAWLLVGQPDRAWNYLEPPEDDPAVSPPHLWQSRLRWGARCLESRGDSVNADVLRREIEGDPYRLLAMLDETLHAGGDPEPIIADICTETQKGDQARRLMKRRPADYPLGSWMADHFPY